MKYCFRIFIVIIVLISSQNAKAQIYDGATWTFSVQQADSCEATLIFKAVTNANFHIYSQHIPGNDGPIPTAFVFKKNKKYATVGNTEEDAGDEAFDPQFQMMVKSFHGTIEFKQKIKITTRKAFRVSGVLTYMACDDKQCLPPTDVDFTFEVNQKKLKSCNTVENDPSGLIEVKDTPAVEQAIAPTIDSSQLTAIDTAIKVTSITTLEPGCGGDGATEATDKSLLGIFLAGFIGGLLALLTPCVFPMIPMTVSFFTKRSGSKKKGMANALIYGLSIIIIYVSLGFFVTVTLGSDALNDLASNVFFNMAFFIIFMIFAFSFFGAFEIVIPSSLVNKADQASDKGGLIGIFFMAFTLSLVSFSCTGPIIGTLLVEAAHGGSYMGPITGMTGFALALALPFTLFSAFPGWLNSLPKSGGWLNTVKVTLGFIELALALKFLSNVDLAYHWGILKRETFIALWVIIFGMLGF